MAEIVGNVVNVRCGDSRIEAKKHQLKTFLIFSA